MLKRLQQQILQHCTMPATVEILKGTQSGIWGLFRDIITVNWAYHQDDAIESEKVNQDAQQLGMQLNMLLQKKGLPNDSIVRYVLHTGVLNADKPMDSQWRSLFAQAIIKLDILERNQP
jgi:hypothetical protein